MFLSANYRVVIISNSTFSVFPEMQTALRTYHPVPSLSKTGGNLQDAPRIRKMLKASQLTGEDKADLTLADILTRSVSQFCQVHRGKAHRLCA